KTVPFVDLGADIFQPANRQSVQCKHFLSQQKLCMYLLTRHLRPRNSSNHFLSQPQLPLQRRCLLRLDIRTHLVQSDVQLAPRNPVWRGFDMPAFQKTTNHIAQTTAQTIQQRLHAELDVSDSRRSPRLDLKHYSVHTSHPAFETIVDLFVETISDQIH